MSPQQRIFTALLTGLQKAGFDVYDGALPPEGTPYPFIYLAGSEQSDTPAKSGRLATTTITAHVWHDDAGSRGTVSDMLESIACTASQIKTLIGADTRIIADDSTSAWLLHGVCQLTFIS